MEVTPSKKPQKKSLSTMFKELTTEPEGRTRKTRMEIPPSPGEIMSPNDRSKKKEKRHADKHVNPKKSKDSGDEKSNSEDEYQNILVESEASNSESDQNSSSSEEDDQQSDFTPIKKRVPARRKTVPVLLSSDSEDDKASNSDDDEESDNDNSQSDDNEEESLEDDQSAPMEGVEGDSESEEEKPKKKKSANKIKKSQVQTDATNIDAILASRPGEKEPEFLVRDKGQSFVHARWLPQSQLVEEYNNGKMRVKKFLEEWGEEGGDPEINPDYTTVDRIITCQQTKDGKEYLVKWKVLPYDEATWEYDTTVLSEKVTGGQEKIDAFEELHDKSKLNKLSSFKQPSMKDLKKDPEEIDLPEFKDGRKLKSYQEEGFRWLAHSWLNGRNTILGDEMGLGKTIQALSILQHLYTNYQIKGPFLVIGPMSCLEQWKREIEAWTHMQVVIFQGSAAARDLIMTHEWYYEGSSVPKFDILLTSFDVAMIEKTAISKIPWKYLVIDEAHRLKNKDSKLFTTLTSMKYGHKLLLTGTPIQNNVKELWNLLNFIEPKRFGDAEKFMAKFGTISSANQVEKLHQHLGPFLLRRTKDALTDQLPLPKKEEILVEIEATKIQKAYYKAIWEKNKEFLMKGTNSQASLMNIMIELRKCCNHPFLIRGARESIEENFGEETETPQQKAKMEADLLVSSSTKFVFVDKLLERFTSTHEKGKPRKKLIIFSQMVRLLELLQEFLEVRGYAYERLDGSMNRLERQQAIDRFTNKTGESFVFLASTKAGGLGLNLTIADTVIIFDSDWNPQNDLQAQARCHRIGQENDVKVYRLITKNTYEKRMFEVASRKLGLERAILGTMEEKKKKDDEDMSNLSKTELEKLLKYGAYHFFNDENQEENFDLDQVLGQATTINYDQKDEKSTKFSEAFSKATFCASEDDKINMDDKNFWAKVLPKQKSAKKVLTTLQEAEKNAFAEAPKRTGFIRECEKLYMDYQIRAGNRIWSELSTEDNDTLAVFDAVLADSRFTDNDKRKIGMWRDAIKPRARAKPEMKTTKKAKEEEMDVDDSSEDSQEKEKKSKAKKSGKTVKPAAEVNPNSIMNWSKAVRDKARVALMVYGPGRAQDILKSLEGKRDLPSVEELDAFSQNYISFLTSGVMGLDDEKILPREELKGAEAKNFEDAYIHNNTVEIYASAARAAIARAVNDESENSKDVDAEEWKTKLETTKISFTTAKFVLPGDVVNVQIQIQTSAKEIKKIRNTLFLGLYYIDPCGEPDRLCNVKCIPLGSYLEKVTDSVSIEVPVVLPGFMGKYVPQLCFGFRAESIKISTFPKKAEKQSFEIGHFPFWTESTLTAQAHVLACGKLENLVALNRHFHPLLKKDADEPWLKDTLEVSSKAGLPFPSWTVAEDRKLLFGVYKHGLNKFEEIMKDSSFQWGSIDVIKSKEIMLDPKMLAKRAQKLISLIVPQEEKEVKEKAPKKEKEPKEPKKAKETKAKEPKEPKIAKEKTTKMPKKSSFQSKPTKSSSEGVNPSVV